jgi:hypothetical protein
MEIKSMSSIDVLPTIHPSIRMTGNLDIFSSLSFSIVQVTDISFVVYNPAQSLCQWMRIDIGAQTQDLPLAMKWGSRCRDEFVAQVNKELAYSITPTPYMMGLDLELKYMQLQHGFVGGFVLPLWQVLASCLPRLRHAADRCEANVASYKENARLLQDTAEEKRA